MAALNYTKGRSDKKVQARSDTLLTAIRRSGIQDFKVVSLCSRQTDDDGSEINQLLQQGLIRTKKDYIGIDIDKHNVLDDNRADHPEATFLKGWASDALPKVDRTDGRPLVVYLDFMGLRDIFHGGNVTDPYRWKDGDPEAVRERVRHLVRTFPGELIWCLKVLKPGDLVVANVAVDGQGFTWDMYNELRDYLIPTLQECQPWRLAPFMDESVRTETHKGDDVRIGGDPNFYYYKSPAEKNGKPTRGRPYWFTSFALIHQETQTNPLTSVEQPDKVTTMNNTTKTTPPVAQPTTKRGLADEKRTAIYALIAVGISDATIASMAGVSLRTVAAYRANVTMGNSPLV